MNHSVIHFSGEVEFMGGPKLGVEGLALKLCLYNKYIVFFFLKIIHFIVYLGYIVFSCCVFI